MSLLFLCSLGCLTIFMILATYDGVYLHIWKYELFNQEESYFEHVTHTIRAILFPIIIWLLFIRVDVISFYIGIVFVLLDLVVLGVDAYSEKESRSFMGGLPTWEYILHLFANSFHFTTFVLIIATRLHLNTEGLTYSTAFLSNSFFAVGQQIALNLLPGACILGIAHLLLSFNFGRHIWQANRKKIACC